MSRAALRWLIRQGAIRGEFRLTEPTGWTIRAVCELISEELGSVA